MWYDKSLWKYEMPTAGPVEEFQATQAESYFHL
jgi:hypothetical protein